MGRPLNKKYFGNRNIGTGGNQVGGNNSNNQNYADDRIGGEGVASYGTIVAGSGWTSQPDAYFSAPNIPGGVTVEGTIHYKALSMAVTANGTGYTVSDIVVVDTGTASAPAKGVVTSILTVNTPNIANGGTMYDINSPSDGDKVTFTHANLSTPLRVRITAVSGSTATQIVVEQAGVWNGPGAPTSMANGVNGFTATTTAKTGGDTNGNGLVLDGFAWGAYTIGQVTDEGDYTVFPSTGTSGTLTSQPSAVGTGAKADVTLGLSYIVVTQKGSGYTSPADAALLFDGPSNGASATAVLTTDSGAVGSATNQENAIVIRANTDEAGAKIGDIIRQVSGRRYKVKTADGIDICKLVASDTPLWQEAYIVATAANGSTYYVTKLTAHKATLYYKSGTQIIDNGATAPWTFDTTANGRVIIENA